MLEAHPDVKPIQHARRRGRQLAGKADVVAAVAQASHGYLRTDPDRLQECLLTQPLPWIMSARIGMSVRMWRLGVEDL